MSKPVALLSPKLEATAQQVLGPYFLPNSPLRTRMYPAGARGSRVKVSGQVFSTDCKPLADAIVHVWVADPQGRYDNQDSQGNPLALPEAKQLYRGRIKTDSSGRFSFQILRPGNYFDEGWKLWRPAHIHIMVECGGFKGLVTQLYFADDAHNRHDIPGDDFYQPELALQLSPAVPQAGIMQTGVYNFVLSK